MGEFFNQKQIDESTKAAEDRSKIMPILPVGIHKFQIADLELKTSKANNPMIVVTATVSDENKPIIEYFTFSKGNKYSVSALITYFYGAFGHKFIESTAQDAEGEIKDIFDQLQQYHGKEFQGAVKHVQELYEPSSANGRGRIKMIVKAKMWYTGSLGTELSFNASNAIEKLDPQAKARLIAYGAGASANTATDEAPATEEEPGWLKDAQKDAGTGTAKEGTEDPPF